MRLIAKFACGFALTSMVGVASAQCTPVWSDAFAGSGIAGDLVKLQVVDQGSGPELFACGFMSRAGGVVVNNLATWDGVRWQAFGSGISGTVRDIVMFDDDGAGPNPAAVFIGGSFVVNATGARNIAKWTGSQWAQVGGTLTDTETTGSQVFSMTVHDDGTGPALYVSGVFNRAGGVVVNRVARWNGSVWSAVGAGLNNETRVLKSFDVDGAGPSPALLFAGGSLATYIKQWDGTSWSTVGGGMDNDVEALEVFDDGTGPALYAGGRFTTAGGNSASHVARWNGLAWSAVGSGVSDRVNDFTLGDDGTGPALFAGGGDLWRWDGSSWTTLGVALSGGIYTLAAINDGAVCGHDSIYVGGGLLSAGGFQVGKIANWTGTAWVPVGRGMNNEVSALYLWDGDASGPMGPKLVAGGRFDGAATTSASRIAAWDGASFSGFGTGINSTLHANAMVYAMTSHDPDGAGPAGPSLIAGGDFNRAGGLTANNIAAWDGSAWSALGDGLNGVVRAVCTFDDGTGVALYATGTFTSSGATSLNRVAKWDGTSWTALGTGLNGSGLALWVFDDGTGPALFVGGTFSTAGDVATISRVAKWDGSQWHATVDPTPASVGHSSAFDAARGKVVLLGGGSPLSGATWTWSNGQWTDEGVAGPSARSGHAMVYDSARQVVVAFGGEDASGLLGDTWTWDGASWTLAATTGPSARRGHKLAFDSARSQVVLFGGTDGTLLGDTWTWDGTTWTLAAAGGGPSAREAHAMVYSPVADRVVLFGGNDGAVKADTWMWNGSAWTEVIVSPAPNASATRDHAMVFNTLTNQVNMFGGRSASGAANNIMYIWTGTAWAGNSTTPWARFGHSMNFDTVRNVLVLFGGVNETTDWVDTWERTGNSWSGKSNTVPGNRNALLSADLGSGERLLAGGTSGVRVWDGVRWSTLGTGLTGEVRAMTMHSGNGPSVDGLYVTGIINTTNGVPFKHVARWSGSAWQAIGGADNLTSGAIASFDDDGAGLTLPAIYMGGEFTSAGGMSAASFTRYGCPPVGGITLGDQPQDVSIDAGASAEFMVEVFATGTPQYQWRRNGVPLTDGVGGGFGGSALFSGANSSRLVVSNAGTSDAGVYDVVVMCQCEQVAADGATLRVGPLCGTADFNGDGDTGTDADIEAFFACLGGNCCSGCFSGGSDFNGDGDVGTDADIESFFRVLAGGPC